MTADWPLVRAVLEALTADDGLTDDQLAERLGMPCADVRTAAQVLYRQRKTDICWGRNVLAPRARPGKRAA